MYSFINQKEGVTWEWSEGKLIERKIRRKGGDETDSETEY